VLPRIVAVVWLALYAYVTVVQHDETATAALGPTAFLAAGFLFGDAVVGQVRERRNGKNSK
jgi:hypothetical protein